MHSAQMQLPEEKERLLASAPDDDGCADSRTAATECDSADCHCHSPNPTLRERSNSRLRTTTKATWPLWAASLLRWALLAVTAVLLLLLLCHLSDPDVSTWSSLRSSVTALPFALAALSRTSWPSLASPTPPTPPLPLQSLNDCRLLSAVRRMQAGQPLRIAAVGGSITRHWSVDTGYAELLVHRLNTRYPITLNPSQAPTDAQPHPPTHRSFNRAQGGTSSAFFSLCMSAFFPDDELSSMDIVLVEFGVNDLSYAGQPPTTPTPMMDASTAAEPRVNLSAVQASSYFALTNQFSSGGRLGEFDPATNIERLLRYTLSRQRHGSAGVEGPAVVLVEFCLQDGSSAQAWHRPVAFHYGVMVVSVCETLPGMWADDDAAARSHSPPLSGVMVDRSHPNRAGHAIAAGMISDRIAGLADATHSPPHRQACDLQADAPLPQPLSAANGGDVDWRCTLGRFRQGAERTRVDSTHEEADMDGGSFTVVGDSGGWVYADEVGNGKWGWQSVTPSSTLTLQLLSGTRHVVLAYLRSYTNIGSADVWMSRGGRWVSNATRIDAWWDRPFSTFELLTLPEPEGEGKGEGEGEGDGEGRSAPPLLLHLRLVDVGRECDQSGDRAPSNKFKLVSIFQR